MGRNIEITTGALIFFCFLFYANPNGIFLPFLLAAGAHEAGHWLVCRLTGGRITSFRVSMAGAQMQAQFDTFASELLSILAGPVVNLFLLAAFLHTYFSFALVNGFLAAYNLLPVLPLDGGRILHLLLSRRFPAAADKVMGALTAVVTVAIVGWGIAATCLWHYGLWPSLFAAVWLLKTGAAMAEEKSLAKCP